MSMFSKATKAKSKLRCALFGPSGSGKTYTSLSIAQGLGNKIAVIDTERGSASKYSDRFTFDVCELTEKTIPFYIKAIRDAGSAGYEVLNIDSMSHGWQELLVEVDKLARVKYKGNTWAAWSEGTPKQRELVDAILDFPGHIIVTMRSKTEWTVGEGKNGKARPERVGLAPEQGKGIEYEFDVLLEMSTDNVCHAIKDRTGLLQGRLIDKPGKELGEELAAWLDQGVDVKPKPAPAETNVQDVVEDLADKMGTEPSPTSLEDQYEVYALKADTVEKWEKLGLWLVKHDANRGLLNRRDVEFGLWKEFHKPEETE